MPIVHQREERFPGVTTAAVRHVHRLAVVFGLVVPLLILLVASLQSGSFSLWPTALARLYERSFSMGWSGLYVFGLLLFLVPSLLDLRVRKKQRRWLHVGLALFAAGRLVMLVGRLFFSTMDGSVLAGGAVVLGDLLSLAGWLLLQYQVFRWFSVGGKRMDLHLYALMAGMIFFLAGLALHMFVDVMLWIRMKPVAPLPWLFALRSLPMIGIGLMTLSFLLRLAPEMLGWRPLTDTRLKRLYGATLMAGFLVSIGYPYFHKMTDTASALMYGLGAFMSMLIVVGLFMSIDFWQVRLYSSTNREHVPYVYASLIWLLLSAAYFVVLCCWELMHRGAALTLWTEPLLYALIGGFFAQAMFGLYTYVANQLDGSYSHTDRIMTWALVLFNWALFTRVFLLPFLLAYGWQGTEALRFVLEAMMYAAVLLMSMDLFIALGGPIQFRRSVLKK